MSGGGKGGSQTTSSTVAIPPYLEEPIKRNIERAEDISTIGYKPYYGLDVAAVTPLQEAAMRNVSSAASAFGLDAPDPMSNLPAAQTMGGVSGYSSGSLYDAAVEELKARRPGQYDAIMSQFIDPITGEFAGSEDDAMNYDLNTLEGRVASGMLRRSGGRGYTDPVTGQKYIAVENIYGGGPTLMTESEYRNRYGE